MVAGPYRGSASAAVEPYRLSSATGIPFYRQLADQIADRIHSGTLAPGAALPSIRQLSAELVVSVITVKGAYETLEADGLVVSHQGKGTFVGEGAGAASLEKLAKDISLEFERVAQRAHAAKFSESRAAELAREAVHRAFRKEK